MGVDVQLSGVIKRYPNGIEAVRGVDLAFPQGQVAVVLGPSGAGKSTLLRMINGLETTTIGTIRVGDLIVCKENHRAVRKTVGMVFQQFNLVPRLTVMANVLCGRLAHRSWVTSVFFTFPESDFVLAREALKQVGLEDRAWDRLEKLSGGQQQRVAIARVLVQQSKVILADEPVASLDPETSSEVLKLLVNSARSRDATLILNLHQVELAMQFADRIVGIRKGQVLFDGPPSNWTDDTYSKVYQ